MPKRDANSPPPAAKKLRLTERQAANMIHGLMQQPEHHDPDFKEKDRKLKIAAGLGLAVFIIGLLLGDQLQSPEIMGLGVVIGLLVFAVALTRASKNYKQAYRRFVTGHMDDDGTFRFCPACNAKQPPHAGLPPRKSCFACGANLWRFDPASTQGNPKQAQRRRRQIENTATKL